MLTIKITELYGDRKQVVSSHRTNSTAIAISRAVKKHYGKRSYFYVNYERSMGLGPLIQYGQIGHPIATNQCTMDTGMVRVDID